MASSIEQTDISDEAKAGLVQKLANFNQVDQRPLLKAVFATLDLKLGEDEDAAWRRRNKAAHGMPIPEGQELAAIRDMKLLRGLFQRMLLRITNAADQYIDYTSPNCPFRRLERRHLLPPELSSQHLQCPHPIHRSCPAGSASRPFWHGSPPIVPFVECPLSQYADQEVEAYGNHPQSRSGCPRRMTIKGHGSG